MKHYTKYIIPIILLITFAKCDKEPVYPIAISVINNGISSVDYTAIIIQFSISGVAYKAGVLYGTEQELATNAQILYTDKAEGDLSVQLKDLEQGTEYFYKVFAEDKKGNKIYSEIKNFITKASSLTTGDASNITFDSALLPLSFNGVDIIEAGVVYTTDKSCIDNISTISIPAPKETNLNLAVKNLICGTKYYYKAYIKYKNGNIHYGEIKSFYTNDIEIPISIIETDLDGGMFEFELNNINIDWTISTTQYWTSVNTNSNMNKLSVKVYIDPVLIPFERRDSIIIKDTEGNSIKTIPIIQKSKEKTSDQITLSIPGDYFWEEGGQNFFVVHSNTSWFAISNKDWCKIVTTHGNNQQLVFYTVEPLENLDEQRTAIITVRSNDGVQFFSVGQNSTKSSIFYSGGAINVCNYTCYNMQGSVKAINSWTISSSEEWYIFEKQSGVGEQEIWALIQENKSYKDRVTTNILKSGDQTFLNHVIQRGMIKIIPKELPYIEMIYVQGGSFMMGNNENDECKPIHKVTLNDYYIGKYEVTQRLWEAVMGNNPSYYIGDNLPVNNITWNQANEFIKKLNSLTGKKYRLPTEAEWEYAAKGGHKSMNYLFSGSNSIEDVCNMSWKTSIAFVGSKKPNELGIYDMTGNVSEYCSDWYGSYSSKSEINPIGPTTGEKKVVRGKQYLHSTVTDRYWNFTDIYSSNNGFRIVLDK